MGLHVHAELFRRCISMNKGIMSMIKRNTWIFEHVFVPESTAPGCHQRLPSELQSLQKYRVIQSGDKHAILTPINVILLNDIEGNQFDIVEVDRVLARNDLLLTKKAVYASPFNIQYYERLKKMMKDELDKRIRIPYEYIVLGRELQKCVVTIGVSIVNQWTLNSATLRAALRQQDIFVTEDAIIMSKQVINGPNFQFEAMLIRFYILIANQYVIPMIGRINHVSADDSISQMLYPDQTSSYPTNAELAKYGLRQETPYFHTSSDLHANDKEFDVYEFMQKRLETVE